MRLGFVLLAVLLQSGCEPAAEGEPVARVAIDGNETRTVSQNSGTEGTPYPEIASAMETACRSVIFEDTSLTHCVATPERHRISMRLARTDGEKYRSLAALSRSIGSSDVAFAMNGGMYEADGDPVGYYVEGSERLGTLNTNDGRGNFHLKPNGVFYGTDGEWVVRSTESFLANVSDRPEFGTQSGPMLVIDGKLHPEITRDGPSRLVRNGVGVDADGQAHFVISNAPLSFGKLARFFRDELETPNALFLDGNVSALWNPATGRIDGGAPLGPLIVVTKREQ